MACGDPYPDLEILADGKLLGDEEFGFVQFPQLDWNQPPLPDDPAGYEPVQMHYSGYNSSGNVNPNDYLTQPGFPHNQVSPEVPIYFHPGFDSSTSATASDASPQSPEIKDEESSVKQPRSRDRSRHRVVEKKYRDRINTKMDELCALLTPDGRPKMQKWNALNSAINLIKTLRRNNTLLRNDNNKLQAQVYTLQCALNRAMGVDFVPGASFPTAQQRYHKMAGSNGSPPPVLSPGSMSDEIPVQKARVNIVPGQAYSPLSPSSASVASSASFSDSSSGAVSAGFLPQAATQPAPQPVGPGRRGRGAASYRGVHQAAPTAAIPQSKTILACVLFSVLFFWNPFIAVSQSNDFEDYNAAHNGHDHRLERVYEYGSHDSASLSWTKDSWLSSTYIIAGLIHVLLFLWLIARLFVLPEVMLVESEDAEIDVDTAIKKHARRAHDHIANKHYSVAFDELSSACALMGCPLPQTSLDVALSFLWAGLRQFGHIMRIGTSITVWMVQFLTEGPLQPNVLHRRLTTCASIQQKIVKLADSGKIDLPVCTKLSLALSSISLQEVAYALGSSASQDRHFHLLLEDSYVTAGIFVLQLPLPVCFFARYYFFQAAMTAKLFGAVDDHRRFGWLYGLDSTTTKDLASLSTHSRSKQDASKTVFFGEESCPAKGAFAVTEPWSQVAWLRSRDLLTELLSCLTLSVPASSPTSIPKAFRSRSIDSISDYCLSEMEQIENCLRGGISNRSRFGSWLRLLRGCQAWRRADQSALVSTIESMMEDKDNTAEADPSFHALYFALAAYSLLPQVNSRYVTIQRLLRSSSRLLECHLHEDPEGDIIPKFCRLLAAEMALSCRLHLASHPYSGDKRTDLAQAESCMTVYLTLLDRMAPSHPRALMYRSRMALVAGESPIVAERFAKTAVALTCDSNHTGTNHSTISLLSAEAIVLLALVQSKMGTSKQFEVGGQQERQALQSALQSYQENKSQAMVQLCNRLIGVE